MTPVSPRQRGLRVLAALVLSVVVLAIGAPSAHADALTPSEDPARVAPETALPAAEPALKPGLVPTLGALVPGFILHGSGTYLARDPRTAKRLAIAGGAGLGAFLLGGVVLATTGTSRRLAGVFVPIVFSGAAVFFTSWLADLYGASTGGRAATAASFTPWTEWELGYRYVYDPQFAYRSFGVLRGDLRYRGLRVSPMAMVALDDDNQRLGLDLAYRLRGRRPDERSLDGSFLDVTGGLLFHRYGSEHFSVWTPSLALEGRLDLFHVGRSLRGAFVEGQLGAGLEQYRFDGFGQAHDDAFGLLLARFGFGLYFGSGATRTGELSVYYDHRHDDFAAGLGVRGIAAGIAGHVGTQGLYFFDRHWGASALLEVGAAVVTGLSVRYRVGGEP